MLSRLHIALLLVFACTAVTTVATPLSRQQALARVQAVLESKGMATGCVADIASKAPATQQHGNLTTAPYYIFSGNNAFVIASGDDRLPAVLGYSDSNAIDPNDMPEGMKLLLEKFEHMAASADSERPIGTLPGTGMVPLIKTSWGQGKPFDRMCPALDTLGTHANPGGVATAMGQIMYFFRWPGTVEEIIPAYVSTDLMIEIPLIYGEDFPFWNNIKQYYHDTDRDSTSAAVAQLMRFCSQSVKTNYSRSSTAALVNAVPALVNYFKFARTAQYLQRKHYTGRQWAKMLSDEIHSRRPVIYRAQRHDGVGQAFLCDGIDRDGLVHINWGWQGSGDGYFLLTEINPGDSIGCDAYGIDAAMVIGIQPNRTMVDTEDPGVLSFHNLALPATQYARQDGQAPFEGVIINGRFANGSSYIGNYDLGFAVYDSCGNCMETIQCATLRNLEPSYGAQRDWSININASAGSGHYTIKPVSRVSGNYDWTPCYGSEGYQVEAVVDGNTLTVMPRGNAAPPELSVDSVAMTGTMQARRAIKTTVTVTNAGESELSSLYLLLDGTCVTAATCEIQQGCCGTVTMHFTPATVGNHEVMIALDRNGSKPLWRGSMSAIEPQEASLEITGLKFADLRPGQNIASGTMSVTAIVSNTGTTPYNDVIVAEFHRQTSKSGYVHHATRTQAVTIAPGGLSKVTIGTEHLTGDEYFNVSLRYYDKAELVEAVASNFYLMMGDLKPGDLNGDRTTNVTDVSLLINEVLGRPAYMDYEGRDDANNDGNINVTDINRIINTILGKEYK